MSSACRLIFMQIKVIFIRKVSHLDSFWNKGSRELGNGLISVTYWYIETYELGNFKLILKLSEGRKSEVPPFPGSPLRTKNRDYRKESGANLSVLCISALLVTVFPSASLRICLFKLLRQHWREETRGTGIKVERKELKSQPFYVTGRMKPRDPSMLLRHSLQTGGIFGEISILLCLTLVHLLFLLCLDSRY